MKGRRVYPFDGQFALQDGDYGFFDGRWMARVPGNHASDLSGHTITEHEDGTITASPSIKVTTTRPDAAGNMIEVELWHGHLEKGVWNKA